MYNWSSNKSDLRPHHDRLASSRPSHAIHKLGPHNHNHGPTAVIHLRPTSDWPVMLCDQLATDVRPGRDRLMSPVWLGKSLHDIKISRVTCDQFPTGPNDIRGHRMNHDQPAKTCDQRRIQLRVGSLAIEIESSTTGFFTFKSGRGACRFQWQVGPRYCEYSGETYDLLVSNTGGLYDLVDHLPSNREFGHMLVVSRSQVPRKFNM